MINEIATLEMNSMKKIKLTWKRGFIQRNLAWSRLNPVENYWIMDAQGNIYIWMTSKN